MNADNVMLSSCHFIFLLHVERSGGSLSLDLVWFVMRVSASLACTADACKQEMTAH